MPMQRTAMASQGLDRSTINCNHHKQTNIELLRLPQFTQTLSSASCQLCTAVQVLGGPAVLGVRYGRVDIIWGVLRCTRGGVIGWLRVTAPVSRDQGREEWHWVGLSGVRHGTLLCRSSIMGLGWGGFRQKMTNFLSKHLTSCPNICLKCCIDTLSWICFVLMNPGH